MALQAAVPRRHGVLAVTPSTGSGAERAGVGPDTEVRAAVAGTRRRRSVAVLGGQRGIVAGMAARSRTGGGRGTNQHAVKGVGRAGCTAAPDARAVAAARAAALADVRDGDNPAYEDPLNPGLIVRDYCSCEGVDHDYDCELDEDNR